MKLLVDGVEQDVDTVEGGQYHHATSKLKIFQKKKILVGYVYIEEAFVSIFNMGR